MTRPIRNILFIMADQLRWDHLSCYGHPHLRTPNIDRLAKKGVRFDRAYVQSPVCGPSRASFYTGRTVFSHGSTWNGVPLPIGELTIGDYLRPYGTRVGVVGKTHMVPDSEGMARLGLNKGTEIGCMIAEPGFEPFERDDGVHPTPLMKRTKNEPTYNDWLRKHGYASENPWNDFANSAEGPDGELLSGWKMRNSGLPARVAEEHSETAYMTKRAQEFIEDSGDVPWLCHLSYIKPHWPYMAPAPYNDMYGQDDMLPVHRSQSEWNETHPVHKAFMEMPRANTMSDPKVRNTVMPTYMGLIHQIDDHLGRLFKWLEDTGRADDTMIVFTSDHGDYLGDHWLGEKELFHEASVRVPLIIFDPRPEAESTRGTVCDRLVEAIDLVPTFLEARGARDGAHRLEGRSLQPLMFGEPVDLWRNAVFSEIDYFGYLGAPNALKVGPSDARGYMLRTDNMKYIYFKGFRPLLFDLKEDPDEFKDLAPDPHYKATLADMHARLAERLMDRKNRVTVRDEAILSRKPPDHPDVGILIGYW